MLASRGLHGFCKPSARRICVGGLARRLSITVPTDKKKLPRPFEEIPRACPFPVVDFQRQPSLPLNLHQQQKLEKYGAVYRDRPFSALSDYVVVHKPEDVEVVFFKGGRYPSRCIVSASKAVRKELGIGMGITFL